MKKVVICSQEQVVPEICHTDVSLYGNMIVAEEEDGWYLLSLFPGGGGDCYWKEIGTSSQSWGGKYATPQEAIERERSCFEAIYSFENFDEFVKFYQEKSNG